MNYEELYKRMKENETWTVNENGSVLTTDKEFKKDLEGAIPEMIRIQGIDSILRFVRSLC